MALVKTVLLEGAQAFIFEILLNVSAFRTPAFLSALVIGLYQGKQTSGSKDRYCFSFKMAVWEDILSLRKMGLMLECAKFTCDNEGEEKSGWYVTANVF